MIVRGVLRARARSFRALAGRRIDTEHVFERKASFFATNVLSVDLVLLHGFDR